ncbi:MAG: MarR family transcriptional regulator [Candidatus Caldatribacteriota bacterium]|nr:MarR family transcriptional regulator [Candidatus Caldatribacteriota bacterium]
MSKFESISQIVNLSRNFNRTLKHEFHNLMQDSGFTLPQLSVISVLAKNGEQKVSDISEKMSLSDSTVSGILDRLEQKGIIERKRNKDDRRVVKIFLGKGSRKICREFHRKREEYFAHLLKKLSEQEINDIIKGLKILNRVFCDKKYFGI